MADPRIPASTDSTDRIVPSAEQLRALAHPIRLKMLGMLRLDGPQTATTLAVRMGLNSGATSYHLRQLATYDFIEEAPELGNARERWWRASHFTTRVDDATADGASAFLQAAVLRYAEMLQASAEEFDELPVDWKRGSTHSDWTIRLTAEQSRGLVDHVMEFLTRMQEESPGAARAGGGDGGTEQVMVQFHVFPRPGAVPHDDETEERP